MKTLLSTFSQANKIRSKLLLFTDQEIQSKIKQNKLKDNLEKYQKIKLCQYYIKTYSYQTNTVFMSCLNMSDLSNLKKRKKTTNSENSFSTCEITPSSKNLLTESGENLFNVHYLNSSLQKNSSYYSRIFFRQKCYSIKRDLKPSSTFQIYKKPKTDKKYLKNLCDSLKIPSKKNAMFSSSKIKYRVFVNNTNKREFSLVKNLKKKNKNNQHL